MLDLVNYPGGPPRIKVAIQHAGQDCFAPNAEVSSTVDPIGMAARCPGECDTSPAADRSTAFGLVDSAVTHAMPLVPQ